MRKFKGGWIIFLLFVSFFYLYDISESADPWSYYSPAESVDPWSLYEPAEMADPWSLIHLRSYVIDTVRVLNDVSSSLEVNYGGSKDSYIVLKNLKVSHGGDLLVDKDLDEVLYGDEGRFSLINTYLEKLPPRLSYRYNHRDTPLDSYIRDDAEIRRLYKELRDLEIETIEFEKQLPSPSIYLIKFQLPLQKIFSSDEFYAGKSETINIILNYEQEGVLYVKETTHTISVSEGLPHVKFRLNDKDEPVENTQGSWYYGDLHVHDCKDEAGFWRGCPNCDAETENWGDDNSLADLKNQYIAHGAEWFTSTTHSYCINSDSEYSTVRSNSESLSGPDFLVIPDTELTSEEQGPQRGSDIGDLICWQGSNHIGAHWIQSWKPGGDDYVFGVCADPIYGFISNIEAIRAEGGFAIANHPASDAWGFNSFEYAHGRQHPDGLNGVEIWNGPTQRGQDGHVGWWVELLLRGEWLCAYSGSDTHDNVFDYGWNHAYVSPEFTSANLKSALKNCRNYVSNYQSIVLYGRTPSINWEMMGSVISVPSAQQTTVRLAVVYDMGSKVGNMTIYEGHVGDSYESVLCSFSNLSGSGYKICTDDSHTESPSYYRVYSETTDGKTAYTNPIFVWPAGK